MMRLTAFYTPPSDPAAFDEHYLAVHTPMAKRLPGLVRFESARSVGTPDGSPAPYHRTAELYFDSAADIDAAFASDLGKETAKDASDLAARTGSVFSLMVSEVD